MNQHNEPYITELSEENRKSNFALNPIWLDTQPKTETVFAFKIYVT